MPTILDHALMAAACVALPIYALAAWRRLRRRARAGVPGARRRAYLETTFIEWGLLGVALAAWIGLGRPPAELGLRIPLDWRFAVTAAIVALVLAFLWRQWKAVSSPGFAGRADLVRQMESVSELLPRTRAERNLFLVLSLTAGICEEVLYRGYLIWYLDRYAPLAVAVAGAVALFGLVHAYQGAAGIVKTAAIGLVAALVYVGSGSLLLAMLLHAAIDVNGGMLGWWVLGAGGAGEGGPGEGGPGEGVAANVDDGHPAATRAPTEIAAPGAGTR